MSNNIELLQNIKLRFGIIGNDKALNRALEKAIIVAPTDISVLVSGESGVGKEFIPKIIHVLSSRKHKQYIAVNCGAIPEGTIDSELFGHEKGSFTGANNTRKGYFEVADGGTIFLDEVAELPLATQVRLLRILETGEFMKVGSSEVQKTNVRIVAATNVQMPDAIAKGRFREDLYYRLNTIQINVPVLRERRGDIHLLFRKFANDFSDKYHMPTVQLTNESINYIQNFYWPGNIRQLRNFAEQLSVMEPNKEIGLDKIGEYLPVYTHLPVKVNNPFKQDNGNDSSSEREILYKFLFDMKKDLNDLKTLTLELIENKGETELTNSQQELVQRVFKNFDTKKTESTEPANHFIDLTNQKKQPITYEVDDSEYEDVPISQESLSLHQKEIELIKRALEKHDGKRKYASDELGISERTLYRKIKQYNLE